MYFMKSKSYQYTNVLDELSKSVIELNYHLNITFLSLKENLTLTGYLTYGSLRDSKYIVINTHRNSISLTYLFERNDRICIRLIIDNTFRLQLCNSSEVSRNLNQFLNNLIKEVFNRMNVKHNCSIFTGKINIRKIMLNIKSLINSSRTRFNIQDVFRDGYPVLVKVCYVNMLNKKIPENILIKMELNNESSIVISLKLKNISKPKQYIIQEFRKLNNSNLDILNLVLP